MIWFLFYKLPTTFAVASVVCESVRVYRYFSEELEKRGGEEKGRIDFLFLLFFSTSLHPALSNFIVAFRFCSFFLFFFNPFDLLPCLLCNLLRV